MNPMMQQHHPQQQQQHHHAPAIDPFGGLTAQRAQGLRSEEEARREKRARERDARLRRAEQQMAAQQQSRFMALKHSMMRKQEEEAMTAQMAAETARLEQEVAAQQAMLETQQMEMQTAMMEQQLAAQQQQLAGMQQASSTNGYPNQSGGGSFNSAGSSFAGQPTAAGGMYGDLALAPSMGGGGGGGDNNFRPATTSAAYGTIVVKTSKKCGGARTFVQQEQALPASDISAGLTTDGRSTPESAAEYGGSVDDVLVHEGGQANKGVLDAFASLGGRLNKDEAILLGVPRCLFVRDFALGGEVTLVAKEENDGGR
eukprot:CAMPEP_0170746470 /NCGR_PEP_ID=MMETSP0437-20130122/8826_1 /TAXON_ID=0 /ORGANISM="Sexangularia sp." /LENGTH=313 /DNA_ID=CAMNT_0011085223 /DNA_START=340 /DNA_END=1279 /DNA_ORIENTATION=-